LGIEDRRFGYPIETIIRAATAGWTIIEVDVSYGPRAPGTSSKVTGSFTGTAKAVVDFYRVLS
ncbi:MAG: glycosyltransferase, partial [Candidatus Nanopelagicales bacterium]